MIQILINTGLNRSAYYDYRDTLIVTEIGLKEFLVGVQCNLDLRKTKVQNNRFTQYLLVFTLFIHT